MERLGRVVATCAGVLGLWAAPAAAVPVKEFWYGFPPSAQPRQVTAGPGGDLWVTLQADPGYLARVTPQGSVTLFDAPDSDRKPEGLAVGPDGNLWLTMTAGYIGRMSPQGVTTRFGGLSGSPQEIVTGPDGNLWFTQHGGARGAIARITPAGVLTEFTAGLPLGSAPQAIAAGPDGALWFTIPNLGLIGRATLSGAITTYATGIAGGGTPWDIVTGPDGHLWFTASAAPGHIVRMTTAGDATAFRVRAAADAAPAHIVAAPRALYFTQTAGGATSIGRIDPAGTVTELPLELPFAAAAGIAVGPDHNLWAALQGRGTVARVIPAPDLLGGRIEGVGTTTATLVGELVTGTAPATLAVEHWSSSDPPRETAPSDAAASTDPAEASVQLSGLREDSEHFARLVARNEGWTVLGPALPFRTAAAPVQTPPPPGPADPAPELGRSVAAAPVRGRVRVRRPGSRRFERLAAGASIPVGSVLDTRRGIVELASALPDESVQTATFRKGRFQVRQSRKTGMTRLALRGSLAGCRRSAAADPATAAAAKKKKRKKKRRKRKLWGKDQNGRYSTHGRDSVATVRGTEWLTVDRCNGTLTRVRSGAVIVRDRRTKRRVVVRAGESFLAKRRR